MQCVGLADSHGLQNDDEILDSSAAVMARVNEHISEPDAENVAELDCLWLLCGLACYHILVTVSVFVFVFILHL